MTEQRQNSVHKAAAAQHAQLTKPDPCFKPAKPREAWTPTERLYMALYWNLYVAVSDAERLLPFPQIDDVLSRLSESLVLYEGEATEEAFMAWATPYLQEQAHLALVSHNHRSELTPGLLAEFEGTIYAAIYKEMPEFKFDNSHQVEDIFQEIAIRVFIEADQLYSKAEDTAQLRNRIYALAKKHILFYHSYPMERHLQLILKRIAQGESVYGDIDTLPLAEHNALKAEAQRKEAA